MVPISFNNLSKSFSYGFTGRQNVLKSISLNVEKGEVFGFLGPNGAGKSTAINIALGFIRPDAGQVLINGIVSTQKSARKYLGYLPEHPVFYDHLKACELLEFSGLASGMQKQELKTRIDPILEKMELLPFKNRLVKTFSKGMKQRIGLAMAMIANPPILILDEPMSGLDPMGRKLVTNLILEMKSEGKTIFFSSHILNDVETLCDSIAVIHKGQSLYSGDVKGFRNDFSNLEDAFIARISSEEDM
jgi:ABC-2 type transport system ATP-binding protein